MRPALLGAQVTSTGTSMPEQRVGFQGWAGLLSTDGKSQNRTEKTFRCLQTSAIPVQSLVSASLKSFWFLPSLTSVPGLGQGLSRVTQVTDQ